MRPGDCGRPGKGPPPPRNPGPRAAHPVTHRRWGLRREEAEEAEEVPPLRGDPRAQPEVPPLPPNSPPAPRLLPGSGSRAGSPKAPAWRMAAGERGREITPAQCLTTREGGVGQLRLLPVGERCLLRLRSTRPILRAPPTGFSHPARTHPGARVSRLSPAP